MLVLTFAAFGLAGLSAEPQTYRPDQIPAALKAGCKVWNVHTPAGKIGSPRIIVRCPSNKPLADSTAKRDSGA